MSANHVRASLPSNARARQRRWSPPVSPALSLRTATVSLAVGVVVALASAACGGIAVVDPEVTSTGGQGGTAGNTTTTTTSTTTVTGTGGAAGSGGTYVPPIDALVEHDLGSVAPGETVIFEVEPPILGMTAVTRVPSNFDWIGFDRMAAPNGSVIVNNFTIPTTSAYYQMYGISALSVPQTDHAEAMPVMGGPWEFTIETDYAGGQPELSIWTRHTVDGEFHGGVIDVNVFRVPSVSSESHVLDVLGEAFDPWYGLSLGQVTFFELSEQFYSIDLYDVFDLYMQTSAAERRPSLNVLLVGLFTGELADAGGFTLGAPGYPLDHGHGLSGVTMLTFNDIYFDALVLRHEAGHLSGLYHTSEFEIGFGDYLSDTPLCPDVWNMMESCPDYDNLMFPTGGGGQEILSPKQQTVIRGSTLYRGIVQEGDPPVPPLDEIAAPGAGAGQEPEPNEPSDVAARETRPRLRARGAGAEWAEGLPPSLAAFLSGIWEVGQGGPPPGEVARHLASYDAELLWSIGADHRAPAYVRMRALSSLGRLAPDATLRLQLARLAATRSAPARVRVGALRALDDARAPELAPLRTRLAHDTERLVAEAAARLGR